MDSQSVVRILLVEDNPFWQGVILRKLREQPNLQVMAIVSDGLGAVQEAEELQPDLILLDLGLPKLHGMEVAKRVRTVSPETRILIVSCEYWSDIAREATRVGALGYVHKLEVENELLPAIQAVLGKTVPSRC